MNGSVRWSFRVGAACAAAVGCVLLATGRAQSSRQLLEFRGIQPGTSRIEALRGEAWPQPASQSTAADGTRQFEYQISPWKQVVAMVRGGTVVGIDLFPPAGVTPEKAAEAFVLGQLLRVDRPSPEARFASEGLTGELLESQGTFVLLELEMQAGRQAVKRIRFFGNRPLPPAEPVKATRPDESVELPPPAPVPDTPPAAADADHARRAAIVKAVLAIVEQHHVAARRVDDEIARRTVERLMNAFSTNTYFFTQADVDRFRRRGWTLVDELRQGDYRLAQEVQDTYVQRVRQRAELLRELLELEHDFTVDESLSRSDATPYARTDDEVRELWRKWVKFWMLRHRASGADDPEAQRRILSWMRGFVEQVEHWGPEDALNALLNSLLQSFDPRSRYLAPVAFEDHRIDIHREMSGIGAGLNVKDGYITVTHVLPESPAARSGQLKVGDRILAVGQGEEGEMADVVGIPQRDVVDLIRGQRGTVVRLRVLPAERFEASVYRITRDRIELTNVTGTVLADEILPEGCQGRVGFVHVPSFYRDLTAQPAGRQDSRSSTRDLEKILQDFATKQVDVVVIDLRENGGGSFDDAFEMTGLFLEGGPVAQAKDRSGNLRVYSPQFTSIAWRGPLVVLTSQLSAGPAELFAGVMADYHRGLVVGDPRTFGLGSSAGHISIGPVAFPGPDPPDLGRVLVTHQKLYLPSGDSFQLRGLTPHLALPSLTAVTVSTEESRPHALAHDTIAPATFLPYASPLAPDLLEALRAASEARRRDTPFFTQLADSIEQEKTRRKRTHDPLKEAEYLAEGERRMPDEDWPEVPEVPAVKLTPYLEEVLAIALELPPPETPPPRAVAPFNAQQARTHQEAWSKYLGQPVEMTNSLGMKLKLIPPGEFQMGSSVSAAESHRRFPYRQIEWYQAEHPPHKVRLVRPYYLGTHEVRVADFERFVTATGYQTTAEKEGKSRGLIGGEWSEREGLNWRRPGFDQQATHPVTSVSWDDAMAFCQWLSREEGRTYRLPTEAEWEFACRAGTETLFFWGDNPDAGKGYLNAADQTGGPSGRAWLHKFNFKDGYPATSPVGRFKPNAFGLYDMQGNVSEWCSDWCTTDYYAESPVNHPTGPASGSQRSARGGGWFGGPGHCRSASRGAHWPSGRGPDMGFRLASSWVEPSGS